MSRFLFSRRHSTEETCGFAIGCDLCYVSCGAGKDLYLSRVWWEMIFHVEVDLGEDLVSRMPVSGSKIQREDQR
jgi:hypothetical protein